MELKPVFSGEKKVKAQELVTVTFQATSNESSEVTYMPTIEPVAGAALIGTQSSFVLKPGASVKIPMTYLIAYNVTDKQEIPIKLKLAPEGGGTPVEASAMLVADNSVCVHVLLPRASYSMTANSQTPVDFSLENCGTEEASFKIELLAGNNITFMNHLSEVTLKPGIPTPLQIKALPTSGSGSYATSITIRVIKNDFTLAQKRIECSVTPPAPAKEDERMIIPLRVNLSYRRRTGIKPQTSLKFSTPLVETFGLGFKTDVWMDSSPGQGDKLEARQQTQELNYGPNKLVFGDQRFVFSKMTPSIASKNYKGNSFNRSFGPVAVTYLKADERLRNTDGVSLAYDMSPKVKVTYGHINYEAPSDTNVRAFKGDRILVNFKPSKNLLIENEISRSERLKVKKNANEQGAAGGVSVDFKKKTLQIKGKFYEGQKEFGSGDFNPQRELSVQQKFGSISISAGYSERKNFMDHASKTTILDTIPLGYTNKTLSIKKEFKPRKMSLTLKGNLTNTDQFNTKTPHNPYGSESSYLEFIIAKQLKHLSLTTGFKSGRDRKMTGSKKSNSIDFRTNYRRGNTSLVISQTRASELDIFKGGDDLINRRFSSSFQRTLSKRKASIGLGWRHDYVASSAPGSPIVDTYLIRTEKRFANNKALNLEYELISKNGKSNGTFSTAFSRDLSIPIPYKKFGSVSGRLFVDFNHDGEFNNGDKPVEDVSIRLVNGQSYYTRTDAAGLYKFEDIVPDDYTLTVDKGTFPVGVSLANGDKYQMKVRSGKKVQINIKFTSMFKVSGKVKLDSSNFFIKYSNISVANQKILLLKDGQVIDTAFTDKDGSYYIENIKPGVYEVAIDKEWMPEKSVVIGRDRTTVLCGVDESEIPAPVAPAPPVSKNQDAENMPSDGTTYASSNVDNLLGELDDAVDLHLPGAALAKNLNDASPETIAKGSGKLTADGNATDKNVSGTTSKEHYVNCVDLKKCTDIDFVIGIKQKEIRKTYSMR